MNLVSHLLLSIARKHASRLRRNLSPQHRRGKRLYRLVDSPPSSGGGRGGPSPASSSRAPASSSSTSPRAGRDRERGESPDEAEERERLAEEEWIRRILKHASRHPRAARWQQPCRWPCVRDGETALHAACRRCAPPEVVRAVLAAYPPAAALRSRGGEGYTPLHALCASSHTSNSTSTSGSRTTAPNGNGSNNSSSHTNNNGTSVDDRDVLRRRRREERQLMCMEVLLETRHGRGALSARDAFGRTPLHLLCLRNGPPNMVRFLLEAASAACDDASPTPPPSPSRSNFLAVRRGGSNNSSGPHPTTTLKEESPPSLLVIQDAMGNTPLHYAASRGCPEETVRLLLSADEDCLVDRNSDVVASSGASAGGGGVRAKRAATIRNRSGCLPLHYGCYCAPARPGVLRLLVRANPTAVCAHSGNNNRRTGPVPSNTNTNTEGTNEENPDEDGDTDDGEDDGDEDDGEEEEDDDDDDFESVSSPVALETAAWGAAAGGGATPLAMLWRRYAFGPEDRALLSSVTSVDQMRGDGGGGGGIGEPGEGGEMATTGTATVPTAACTRGGPLESLWEDAAAMLRASRVVRRGLGCDSSWEEEGNDGGGSWCREEDGGTSDGVGVGVTDDVLDGDVLRVLHAVAATRGGGGCGGNHRRRRRRRGGGRSGRNVGGDGGGDDGNRLICPRGMVELIDRLFDTLVRDAVASSRLAEAHREEISDSKDGGGRSDEIGDRASHGDDFSPCEEVDGDEGSLEVTSSSSSSSSSSSPSSRKCDNHHRNRNRNRRRCPSPTLRDLFVGAIAEVGMRWGEGLDELWRADPDILARPLRHGRYGVVYPFALAGCVGRHPREPPADVDTIYQLIRRRPDVIRMGVVP